MHTLSTAVRMDPAKGYRYVAADTDEYNPNDVPKSSYTTEIGSSVNEVEEYLDRRIQAFTALHGIPTEQAYYFTNKKTDVDAASTEMIKLLRKFNWDQGE